MPSNSDLKKDDIFQQTATRPFSSVHFGNNAKSQLQVIIAIHNTVLGPALGGCRLMHYGSSNAYTLNRCFLGK